MELLFEFLFPLFIEAAFALLFGSAEYALYRTHKRFWMWVFGVAAIALMIWWRGSRFWTTWAFAGGWLAILAYLDRRLMAEAP